MPSSLAVVVFDAYGTLFDVHSVVVRCEQLFPGRGRELSQLWRNKQLEYTWLRSLMGRYRDFDQITTDALHYACATLKLGLTDPHAALLLREYLQLAPYPEVRDTLVRLTGIRRAILSNGSPSMLKTLVRNSGLTGEFEELISVDRLKIYKPHPSVYQLAVDALRAEAASIAFVSSNFWDVTGAASFGFRTFWINRAGAQPDPLGYTPAAMLNRLDDLPQALTET